MHYTDRMDAAFTLMPLLEKYKSDDVVILAIPRGGVPLAYYLAKHFQFPVDLLMTKKIGHPLNPEFAVGAVSLEDVMIDEAGENISSAYKEQKINEIRKALKERYKLFMGDHKPLRLKNKVLIIVDDGIATGNTILSAIRMLRKKNPAKIIVAAPVAPPDVAARISLVVDDLVCPYMPVDFYGVGYHYMDFSEVSDEEVIQFLKMAEKYRPVSK